MYAFIQCVEVYYLPTTIDEALKEASNKNLRGLD